MNWGKENSEYLKYSKGHSRCYLGLHETCPMRCSAQLDNSLKIMIEKNPPEFPDPWELTNPMSAPIGAA